MQAALLQQQQQQALAASQANVVTQVGFKSRSDKLEVSVTCNHLRHQLAVWPEKNCQISIKVARKLFH